MNRKGLPTLRRSTLSIAISSLLLLSSATNAGTNAIHPGSSSVTGPTNNHQSLYAAAHNPAMAGKIVAEDENFRMSYFIGIGTNTEIGDANDFVNEVDELIVILDDPSLTNDSIEDTLNRFNGVLEQMGEEGYVKNSTSLYLPLLPLFWKPTFSKGTFFTEIGYDVQWRVSLLDQELRYNDQNLSFETGSAAYIKSGIQKRLSFGYSQPLFSEDRFAHLGGRLYGGLKANVYNLELSKQVFHLQQLDGKDIEDVVEDEYENNLRSTTAIGLDAGLLWDADRYRVGLTFKDINSPTFDYGEIGVNCSTKGEATIARSNCELTKNFAEALGEIRQNETHTKPILATTDATFFITNRWTVNAYAELAAYDDIVGTQNQWTSIGTAYYPKSYWLPSVRLGLQKNLAGSKISSYGLGLTFFKLVNLDVATSSEKVTHEDTTVPRRFSFSLSIEERF